MINIFILEEDNDLKDGEYHLLTLKDSDRKYKINLKIEDLCNVIKSNPNPAGDEENPIPLDISKSVFK